jgi:hypothetical protein
MRDRDGATAPLGKGLPRYATYGLAMCCEPQSSCESLYARVRRRRTHSSPPLERVQLTQPFEQCSIFNMIRGFGDADLLTTIDQPIQVEEQVSPLPDVLCSLDHRVIIAHSERRTVGPMS